MQQLRWRTKVQHNLEEILEEILEKILVVTLEEILVATQVTVDHQVVVGMTGMQILVI